MTFCGKSSLKSWIQESSWNLHPRSKAQTSLFSNRDKLEQDLRVHTKKLFFIFLNQTYVVGTQKNCLN